MQNEWRDSMDYQQRLKDIKKIPPAFYVDKEYPPDIVVRGDDFNLIRETAIHLLEEKIKNDLG
jgi:hypothetical protein